MVRRNTVTRSCNKALSEDCWTLTDCITHLSVVPRVLLKNGKRNKLAVASQLSSSSQVPLSSIPSSPPESQDTNDYQLSSPAPISSLPNPGTISNRYIARELSSLNNILIM